MRIIKKIIFFCILYFQTLVSFAAGTDSVQFIAIHFGDPEYAKILNKEEFPHFSFYNAPGKVTGYTEEQKIIGNTSYLKGWYGEVPEKMAFGASYRGSYTKAAGFPYEIGVIYVIDPRGFVAFQMPPELIYADDFVTYDKILDEIMKTVEKIREGKFPKRSSRRFKYIKKSPVGKLEKTQDTKYDSKGKGLFGYRIPEIQLSDDRGNNVTLEQITSGKISIVLFYTLNGVYWKRGNKEGGIMFERKGEELKAGEAPRYPHNSADQATNKNDSTKYDKDTDTGFTYSFDIMNKIIFGENLSDPEKINAYNLFLQHIRMLQKITFL